MADTRIVISFYATAEDNRFARSLAEALRKLDPSIQMQLVRERGDTQDFGASLVVILDSTTVTALAKGIASWLARNKETMIAIHRSGHKIFPFSPLDSTQVPQL